MCTESTTWGVYYSFFPKILYPAGCYTKYLDFNYCFIKIAMAAMLLDKLCFSVSFLCSSLFGWVLFSIFYFNSCTVKFVSSHNSWSFRKDLIFWVYLLIL